MHNRREYGIFQRHRDDEAAADRLLHREIQRIKPVRFDNRVADREVDDAGRHISCRAGAPIRSPRSRRWSCNHVDPAPAATIFAPGAMSWHVRRPARSRPPSPRRASVPVAVVNALHPVKCRHPATRGCKSGWSETPESMTATPARPVNPRVSRWAPTPGPRPPPTRSIPVCERRDRATGPRCQNRGELVDFNRVRLDRRDLPGRLPDPAMIGARCRHHAGGVDDEGAHPRQGFAQRRQNSSLRRR